MVRWLDYSSSNYVVKSILTILILLLVSPSPSHGWDSLEMEVYDVVEEVNQNFYELMGIAPDAKLLDIKKAYRRLSKVIHPDKSDAPDADIQFRQLVAVYEVLRDNERREHYDRVLIDGLPDWRSAKYYYRRARKMSMLEIVIILTVVISIAQYLMAWGSYIDTYRTLGDALSRKYKTKLKQKKKGTTATSNDTPCVEDELALIPKPSAWNILPVQLCRFSYFMVRHGPSLVQHWRDERKRMEQERLDKIKEEEDIQLEIETEEAERKARKANTRSRRRVIPEMCATETRHRQQQQQQRRQQVVEEDSEDEPSAAGYNTGMWTSEEFCELSKLMNKYPGGTVDRWEVIAEQLNRAPQEVTKMAVKMREKLAAGAWLQEQEVSIQTKIKVKTRAAEVDATSSGDEHWSAVQQKALEKALKSFPKGTDQRWEKIAKHVPEKNSEDCINRFKFLADRIRKKKEEEQAAAEMATQRDPEWRDDPSAPQSTDGESQNNRDSQHDSSDNESNER